MITPAYVETMARYNTWQNANIHAAASALDDAQRKSDRGAFFKSIHATLNHILWADQMWLMRFKVAPQPRANSIPEGLEQYAAWDELSSERRKLDAVIEDWSRRVTVADLSADLNWYSAGAARDLVTPMGVAVTHFFNHQTHHRGQVHGILTGYGAKPDKTDLPFLPEVQAADSTAVR